MADLDMTMVKKGSENSTNAVLEQGEKTLGNATKYLEPLSKAGLPADALERLKAYLADVRSKSGAREGGREESTNASFIEATERAGAKRFIRRSKNAAKLVLKTGPVKGISPSAFQIGELGRSSTELVVQLTNLRPHVLVLDDEFKPFFEQKSAVAELDVISANLSALGAARGTKQDELPLGTLALYEARGKVIDLVERINLVANIAFDGQAEIRAIFNKDILLRDRRRARRKAGPAEQPAGTTTNTTTPA